VTSPQLALVRPLPADHEEVRAATPVPFDLFARHERVRGLRRLDLGEVRAILDDGRFWTEYQPIVNVRSGRTAAFEALGRFAMRDGRPVPPAELFQLLHADPGLLLRAELTLKFHQMEHTPRAPLFLNLDPDAWWRAGDRYGNPFLGLFASSRVRVVVEITENMAAGDAVRLHDMIGALRGRRLPVAIDDLGSPNRCLTFDAIAEADVLKFDRTLLPKFRHRRCRALIQAFVRMARETGAHTVLEGIETTREFILARDLGFDLVQGFLFKDRAQIAKRT
jgi:EAL domain-containing protein (putative c-di-GMP-specific phosphodiesterase class I)